MKRLLLALVAALSAGAASAAVPVFAARCPDGSTVDAGADGRVRVDGKAAKTIVRPDGQFTARVQGVYVDITPRGTEPPLVTRTARGRSFGACEVVSFGAPGTPRASTGARRDTAATRGALAGTRWRLVEFQSMDESVDRVRPRDPSHFTMELKGDGMVTMRLDCNRATGTWSAEPAGDGASGRFGFGPLSATRALCPPPHLDEKVTRHAEFVRGYLLRDGRLHLSLMADGGIFVWEPDGGAPSNAIVPAAPEDGGPRNWEVTGVTGALRLRDQPSAAARVVAGFAGGTILDNFGCRSAGGGVWCDVQPLGGGPRGHVSAQFLKPAVSPDGSVRTGPDDSALRAGQAPFDATGPIPCAQHAGQPMGQCEFGVARAGGGYATVVVKKPDGRSRALYFRVGRPVGADATQAEGDPALRATKERDLHVIRIGTERCEIPDAVVLGG